MYDGISSGLKRLGIFALTSVVIVIFGALVFLNFLHSPAIPTKSSERQAVYKVDPVAVRKQYDILPKSCGSFSSKFQLVIAVITKPDGHVLRQIIRKTWGSMADPSCGVRLIFVLGKIYNETKQRIVEMEAGTYGDILQSNQFHDNYRSSSLKTLSLFQWCAAYCSESQYLMRIDDDVWLNLPKLLSFLSTSANGSTAVGLRLPNSPVERNPNMKWYVPREEFAMDRYPPYMQGAMFAMPVRYLPALIHASQSRKTVFLDDIFIGGILMPTVKLTVTQLPNYVDINKLPSNGRCRHLEFIAVHRSKQNDLINFWKERACLNLTKIC